MVNSTSSGRSIMPRQELAESAVALSDVSMTYRGRRGNVQALDRVNFQIPDGQFVSILGPSGCGKSTLVTITSGLMRPSSGTVEVLGKRVDRPVTDVGIVFQRDLLMPWRTVLENVLLQAEVRGLRTKEYREQARELLVLVGLADFQDKLPGELSGGMRQRVSIVRALLHDPPLLLMDEPFGALDAMTRDQMNIDILRIWQRRKKTVMFVTHSIEEAVFLSDRVLVMSPRPGQVLADILIGLPRPRRLAIRDTPPFREHARNIRALFESMGLLREEEVPPE